MRKPSTKRGALPLVTSSTLMLYTCDAIARPDVVGGRTFSMGYTKNPGEGNGIAGNALIFADSGTADYVEAAQVAGDAAAVLADEWTFSVWVRLTDTPASNRASVAMLGGEWAVATLADNHLAEILIYVESNRLVPVLVWEYDNAGTPDVVEMIPVGTGIDLVMGEWYFITFRRTASLSVDLLINGALQETLTPSNANSDGGSAVWRIGGREKAGAPHSALLGGDVSCVYFSTEAETNEKIENDFRRGVPMCSDWDTAVHVGLELEDQSAAMQDMTDFLGQDWLVGAQFSDKQGAPTVPVNLKLHREAGNLSLAHLRTDSKANKTDIADPTNYSQFLEEGREFSLKFARVPLWIDPAASDWWEKTDGHVDTIDPGETPLTLECQDKGGRLQRAPVTDLVEYSGAIETVAASILTDNGALATLVTRGYIGFTVTSYTPQRGPLLGALQSLYAQAAGATCRYLWDPIDEQMELTAVLPPIENTVPAFVIPRRRVTYKRVRSSIDTVRNTVQITYANGANLDSNGNALPATSTATDATSETNYGPIPYTITESQTSIIDDSTKADALAAKILATLKDPRLGVAVDGRAMPEIDANDLGVFKGDGVQWTADQTLAVASVSCSVDAEGGSTTLTVAGAPTIGPARWLEVEARPGQGRHPITDAGEQRERFFGDLNPVTSEFSSWVDLISGGRFFHLKNFNFATYTRDLATYPPDGWEVISPTVWQTGVAPDTSQQASGGQSLVFYDDGEGVWSEFVAVDVTNAQYVMVMLSMAYDSDYLNKFDVAVWFYDKDGTLLSTGPTYSVGATAFNGPASQEFFRVTAGPYTSFPTAAYMRVRVQTNMTTIEDLWLDAVAPYYGSADALVTVNADQSDTDPSIPVVNNTWTQVMLDDEQRDWVGNFDDVTNFTFVAPVNGLYEFDCMLTTYVLDVVAFGAVNNLSRIRLDVDVGAGFNVATYGPSNAAVDTTGVANRYEVTSNLKTQLWLTQGSEVRMMGKVYATGLGAGDSYGFKSGVEYTRFHVKLKSTE